MARDRHQGGPVRRLLAGLGKRIDGVLEKIADGCDDDRRGEFPPAGPQAPGQPAQREGQ